jgi:heme/copper-type cytochrome/quinol oxidase subunit 2
MAEIVQIPNAASTAKIRNPIAVLALGLITLGIYHIFWWYFINREMADYGRANRVDLGDNPVMSVLAITLGVLIIVPPFVSLFRTLRRVERAQNHALGSNNIAVILLFILIFIPLVNLVVFPIMQSNLNQVWETAELGDSVQASGADATA